MPPPSLHNTDSQIDIIRVGWAGLGSRAETSPATSCHLPLPAPPRQTTDQSGHWQEVKSGHQAGLDQAGTDHKELPEEKPLTSPSTL